MATTFHSASWTDSKDIAVVERQYLPPASDEVSIAVGSVGICGSDLHFYRGDFPTVTGVTPGHEFGGTVSAVGRDVRNIKEGDLVGVEPLLRCGTCTFWLTGDDHVCSDRGFGG